VRLWGGAQSIFPSVTATNTGGTGSVTSYAIPLPSGLSSGDLLLIFITTFSDSAISNLNGTTNLYSQLNNADSHCLYKTATGSEGSTLTITMSTSEFWGTNTFRIAAGTWQGTPEFATATGTFSSADPPSLSPSWGTAKTLWIASAHSKAGTVTGVPTGGYSSLIVGQDGDGDSGCGSAWIHSQVSSLDPGTMSLESSTTWISSTVAVQGP